MVDGGFRDCRYSVDKENALRDALLGARDTLVSACKLIPKIWIGGSLTCTP